MRYPLLRPTAQTRVTTARFTGYDHRDRRGDGAMFDTTNLTTARYPSLASRPPRGLVTTLPAPGGLTAKDGLIWIDGGRIFVNALPLDEPRLTPGVKQLVSMGAYLCIFPDKVYLNTEDLSDFGSMEAAYRSAGTVRYSLCRADGTDFTRVVTGDTEPEDTSAELWLSTAGGALAAMSYSAAAGCWVQLDTVYTKLRFTSQGQLPALFRAFDGVTVSGAAFDEVNGEKLLYAVGGCGETGREESDWAVLVGLLPEALVQNEGSVVIERRVPDMDYVCEAGNRLWGCFYGARGGAVRNELYGSALGDFRNWSQYRGASTDSYTASVGSDGPWTGAVNYLGCPTFFKEERIHQLLPAASGAHAVQETVCRGVRRGCAGSLAVINETLLYLSRGGVCAWQGGFPVGVSAALGEEKYDSAAAGALDGRYYLSARGADGCYSLFVYDIERGLWCREDGLHVLQFAASGGELYALDADTGALWALTGRAGEPEGPVAWEAVGGVQSYETPDRKCVSRLNLRARLAPGAAAQALIEYDGSGVWVPAGELTHSGLGTALLPVRPRRCDHLRLKLTGTGEAELLSVTRVLETGSDVGRAN